MLMACAGAVLLGLGLAGQFGFDRRAAATPPIPVTTGTHTAAGHPVRPASHASDKLSGYPGAPETLVIPALDVRAPVVEEVGVQARGPGRGLLTAPSNPVQVGWYRYRDTGALLIVGHVGDQSTAGALAYIGSLATGSTFSLIYARGARAYRVVAVVSVKKGRLSRALFTAPADGEVVLITCDYRSPFHNGHFANNVYVVGSRA